MRYSIFLIMWYIMNGIILINQLTATYGVIHRPTMQQYTAHPVQFKRNLKLKIFCGAELRNILYTKILHTFSGILVCSVH